jgi:hypothetical protein
VGFTLRRRSVIVTPHRFGPGRNGLGVSPLLMNRRKRLVVEVHRRSLWQVLSIYVIGSWIGYPVILNLTQGTGLRVRLNAHARTRSPP